MISFDQAWAIVAGEARPLGSEAVALAGAHGRILAEPVVAQVDWPPADVSAMDGYAIRGSDGSPLRLVGESFPGAAFGGVVGVGECVRIFTGAPIPPGAERVVMQENATRDGDAVRLIVADSSSCHIRQRGSDFCAGDTLLDAGRRLDARAMVAAAGADLADVCVWRRPRVAILGTGDELVEPGSARTHPGTIPESVSFGVAGLVADWGGSMVGRERVRDQPDLIRHAAATALERSDLLVVTGGASVGDRDYSRAVLADLGLELLFAKVAMKPGKPVWFGRVGDTLVLGLPGNPTSALVTARLFLAPLLAGLGGDDCARTVRWRSATLLAALGPCGERETFTRARCVGAMVEPLASQDSGAQKGLADGNVLIRQRAGTGALSAGDPVDVIDF